MTTRIGINGFGRIGREILRLTHGDPDLEVVMVNDLSPPDVLAHLLKYDSVQGVFPHEVSSTKDGIIIDGRQIYDSSGADPNQVEWGKHGVDLVLECTGRFRDREHCEVHLKQGAKKVIVSAPGINSDVTLVMGVNHEDYRPGEHHIVSNASCTTNCLAPVAKVLDEKFEILKGFMTTIHSYTMDQRLLCGAHKDLRRARAAAINQIPTYTGAALAIGLVLPKLKGKLDGTSIRVPTPNVSLVDLVAQVEKSTTTEAINETFRESAQGSLKGILGFSDEPLVSSDYNGSKFSAVVDGLSTNVLEGNLIKVLAWYDNETAFSQRMVDLSKFIAKDLG